MKKRAFISVITSMIFVWCLLGMTTNAATTKTISTLYGLQSDHMYSGNCDITWEYTHPVAAEKLEITFSTDTQTETNCDYIYILDSNGNQLGKYSGTQLAGKTVTINGNAFKIRLTSNFSISYYGFRVTKIKAYSSQPITSLSQGTITSSVSWNLTSDGTLTIYGNGDMKNYTGTNAPWYSFSNKIQKVVIEEGVTSVGNYAFYYCSRLKEAIVGNGVEEIGSYAFYNATDLCEITLPESLQSVGTYGFENCRSLSDVYYYSTESDFANISLGSNNTYLTNAKKHYILSGNCGENLTWMLGFDGILYITGEGDMENYTYQNSAPWYLKRNEIKGIDISETVTSIGNYAFYYIQNINEIKIPSSVKSIGNYAFSECSNITSFTAGDAVETIGQNAFSRCSKLKSVYIGKNTKTIGDQAFYYASSLSEITVNEENPYLSSSDGVLFDKNKATLICYPKGKTKTSYVVPETVCAIGNYAFYNCTSLTSVTLAENLCTIGEYAFSSCSNITNFEIPQGVEKIGKYAFSSCSKLENIDMPSSLTEIENGTFSSCSLLSEIEIPQSVTKIGSSAFSSCRSLSEISIPAKVTVIGSYAFSSCTNLTSVTISQNVTEIGTDVFSGCSSLTSVQMGENVEKIGAGAFENCSLLSSVKISSKVKEIEYETFKGCTSLAEIEIPDSVTTIGYEAFSGCSSMKEVKIGKGVNLIKEKAFYGCTSLETVDVKDMGAYLQITFEKETSSPAVYADKICENGIETGNIHLSSQITKVIPYTISYSNIKSVTADEENSAYSSQDGVLFSKDKTTLIFYPPAKEDKSYEIPNFVTSLFAGSFSNCAYLESVTVPETVSKIGNDFKNCLSLKSITYLGDNGGNNLNGNSSFSGCSNLETVICPNVKKISNFRDLTKLKRAEFNSAKEIYEYTFYNCISLEYIELPILEKVEQYTFANCSNLKSKFYIAALSSLTIGNCAFYGCSSIPEITIASGYSYNIGSSAFWGCSSLKHIYISQGAGDISDGYKIDFGQFSKSSISSNAFGGVTANVYLPVGYYEKDYGDFGGNLTWNVVNYGTCGKDAFWNYNENTKLLYISGTGEIVDHWFSGSDTPWTYYGDVIKKVTVSSGITLIDSYVFEYLLSAEEIQLPNTLKTLAYNAFNNCESLENLILPASLNAITEHNYGGFIRCLALKNIYYVGTQEEFESIEGSAYASNDGRTVHYLVWNESTATCTEAGVEGYYSFDDTAIYDQIYDISKNIISSPKPLPATGHAIDLKEEIKANCHETGKRERYECENCGLVFEDEKGTTQREDYVTEIDTTNHQGETEIRRNENGYTGDIYCLGCETVIAYGENIYKIQIFGDESAQINSKDITQAVKLGTDKDASLAYIYVKYPDYLKMTKVTPKEFLYAEKEEEYTKDGYTTSVILTQYSDTEYIPKDVIHTPFEMTFDISENAKAGNVEFEVTEETCLIGNDVYYFDEIISSPFEILPKLSESVEIVGEDEISVPTAYTAVVVPDYTTNKEVEWSVDNEEIATVDQTGLLTPVTSGIVTLTATAKDGSGAFAIKTVEIIKYAESIEIIGDDEITGSSQYTAVILPDYTTNKNVKWSVDDETVAKVSEDGLVTPLKNGRIVLTATAEDESGLYFEKSIVVTVNIRIDSLTTNIGEWDREFSSDITEYTITIPETAEEIYFTSSFADAILKVNGSPVGNGREKRVTITENETLVTLTLTPVGDNTLKENTYKVTIIRGTFTKTEICDDIINVTPVNIENGKTVIVALFDGEKFVEMHYATYEGEPLSFTAIEEYSTAKVMVWDSVGSLKPVCETEFVK